MLKYILPLLLLLSSCSIGNPDRLTTEDQIAHIILANPEFQKLVEDITIKQYNFNKNDRQEKIKDAIKSCRKTSACLHKATFLSIDDLGYFRCRLVDSDYEVSCND